MKINYLTGDMFELVKLNAGVVIPHVCNDIGAWGAGFVMALSKHWPVDQKEQSPECMYREWFAAEPDSNEGAVLHSSGLPPFELGQVQHVVTPTGATVVNMIGQRGTVSEDNPRPVKYAALVDCMRKVAESSQGCEIHAPKFGAGLAGGDWHVIEALIEELWCEPGIPVTVYSL